MGNQNHFWEEVDESRYVHGKRTGQSQGTRELMNQPGLRAGADFEPTHPAVFSFVTCLCIIAHSIETRKSFPRFQHYVMPERNLKILLSNPFYLIVFNLKNYSTYPSYIQVKCGCGKENGIIP